MFIIEKEKEKYSFSGNIVAIHACLFPFILYGFIFSIGSIDIHYNIYNISLPNNLSTINNTFPNDYIWKSGFDINISVAFIVLYFLVYIFIDLLVAFIFLIEGGLLWYVSNIIRFYKNINSLMFMITLSVLSVILYIMSYIMKCDKKCFFPGILLLSPFFTIFNVLRSICGYNRICEEKYNEGIYFGYFGALPR